MFFEPISEAFRSGVATRKCPEPDDLEFVRLAVSRVLHETSSGRDFLQTHAIPQVPELTRHSYFKNLGSSRRLKLIGDLKQSRSVHVLTDWKANFKPMSVIPREVDRADPLNALVVSDETVYFANQPGVWRRITALKPDTGENHVSLTNQMTLRPGTLNELRRMRWNIEKAFSEQECKLGEDKVHKVTVPLYEKGWLFMGGETTGQRAAIIHTLVECAKRHGHNPETYLADVLDRLPAMTNQDDLGALLPARWQPATAPGPVVKVEAAACEV